MTWTCSGSRGSCRTSSSPGRSRCWPASCNRLARFSRLILFDKRGTGLSDRVPRSELPSLEERMDDVLAVLECGRARSGRR